MPPTKRLLALGALAFGARLAAGRLRRYSVRDKVVVVAGGSRGLGLVLARELGRKGARLALFARDGDELERARADLVGRGVIDVMVVACDMRDGAQVDRAVASVLERCGRVDVAIDCAGDIEVGPFATMTEQDFGRAMDTNFWGALHLVRAVLPSMRARREGRIVNVSSIGGVVPVPHLLPYVASKFALTGLSLGLRAELANDGVVVTTVCPGLMRTGSPGHAAFKGNVAREHAWFAASDSLPLLSMSAERAARRIVRALSRGEAMVLVGAPAKVAARAQGLAPGAVARALRVTSRVLPAGTGTGAARSGRESRSSRLPWWLTTLSDRAAIRNNEEQPRSR